MDASSFREGCDAGVHRLMLLVEVHVMRPAIAFCFVTRFCRERLLGRNLITVFPTVNNLSQKKFPARARRARRAASRLRIRDARCARADARMRVGKCRNAGKNATFPILRIRECMRSHRITRCRSPLREYTDMPESSCDFVDERRRLCASHKPVCAKLRELFSRIAHR